MKKWFFILLGFGVVLGACKKDKTTGCTAVDSTQNATTAEIDSLRTYLSNKGIPAQEHPSGVFYTIDSTGSGLNPGICNSVAVTYSGYLMDNPVAFESFTDTAGVVLSLQDLILGWQRTMPLLKPGGGMTIFIPPSLAYGAVDKRNGDGDIIVPRNSYLKFNVHLIVIY